MLDEKKTTLHALRHPSLLPLRRMLIAAEWESPSRPRCVDANERRAMQLIARMQAEHKKVFPFVDMEEMAGIDA